MTLRDQQVRSTRTSDPLLAALNRTLTAPLPEPEYKAPVVYAKRTAHEAINSICKRHGITREELCSTSKKAPMVKARKEIARLLYFDRDWSISKIAWHLHKHHTAVGFYLQVWPSRKGLKVR